MLKIDYAYGVSMLDDRGETHWTNFRVKSAAMAFAKALERMGAKGVRCYWVDPSVKNDRVLFESGEVERLAL